MDYFEVPGYPQGKARARTFYNPKIGRSQSITPEKTILYENLVKQSFLSSGIKKKYFEKEPLSVRIVALFPITKSTTKKDRDRINHGLLHPTKKPDADNIAKVICDALNGVAYGDDAQVVDLTVEKMYTEDAPCVFVGIGVHCEI